MQSLRAVNTARTIHELSSLASIYIPLSIPPRLPQYVQLDSASQWHTSALLSMALESMTVPSRVRPDQSQRGLLGDMESILNVNGNQRVASLQWSFLNPTRSDGSAAALARSSHDQRVPGSNTRNTPGEDDLQEANASFDVDLSGGGTMTSSYRRANEHMFARVESLRDREQHEIEANNEDGDAGRKRRRLAGVPTIQRSVRHSHCCGEFRERMEISDVQMFACTFLRVHVQLTALCGKVSIIAAIPASRQLPQHHLPATRSRQYDGNTYCSLDDIARLPSNSSTTDGRKPDGQSRRA